MSRHDEFVQMVREATDGGASVELALQMLRTAGASQIDTAKAIREGLGVDLGEAKELIDRSDTWADRREVNNALRDIAAQAIDDERSD